MSTVTINVFFNGTGQSVDDKFVAANFLAKLSRCTDSKNKPETLKFDGTGVEFGVAGMLFGRGIDQQATRVTRQVLDKLSNGDTVILNMYGHSRGAIAAMLVSKQLANQSKERLNINMVLHDPVPGNAISTARIDSFNISLANKTMDLRSCQPLNKVLALYTEEPLPAIACHAPTFGLYPSTALVEERVVPGCHTGAQCIGQFGGCLSLNIESYISLLSSYQFMNACGAMLCPVSNEMTVRDLGVRKITDLKDRNLNKYIGEAYDHVMSLNSKYDRLGHGEKSIVVNPDATFYNAHHQQLRDQPIDESKVKFSIKPSTDIGHYVCQPWFESQGVNTVINYTLMGLLSASLLEMTIGLSALIGLGTSILAGIGGVLLTSAVLAASFYVVWTQLLQAPTLALCDSFFYPDHHEYPEVSVALS